MTARGTLGRSPQDLKLGGRRESVPLVGRPARSRDVGEGGLAGELPREADAIRLNAVADEPRHCARARREVSRRGGRSGLCLWCAHSRRGRA